MCFKRLGGDTPGRSGADGPALSPVQRPPSPTAALAAPPAAAPPAAAASAAAAAAEGGGGVAAAAAAPAASPAPAPGPPGPPPQANHSRCFSCAKKVGLTGFKCRCGYTFCGGHRYADAHACTFDYKAAGAALLTKANPAITAAKMQKARSRRRLASPRLFGLTNAPRFSDLSLPCCTLHICAGG